LGRGQHFAWTVSGTGKGKAGGKTEKERPRHTAKKKLLLKTSSLAGDRFTVGAFLGSEELRRENYLSRGIMCNKTHGRGGMPVKGEKDRKKKHVKGVGQPHKNKKEWKLHKAPKSKSGITRGHHGK